MPSELLPRVIAAERDALRPLTLAEVPRLHLLDRAFKRRDEHARASEARQALVIVGEGGMGKSVLLGQVLEMLETRTTGSTVLVSSILVSLPEARLTRDEIDKAMGLAVGDLGRQYEGLLNLLAILQVQHGAVTLLIDTLDLLITSETLTALSQTIANALDIGDVVITCRAEEFTAYFEDMRLSMPRLVNRITKYIMPKLLPEEIGDWADRYLSTPERRKTGEELSFLQALQGGVRRGSSLREVCGVPVRLALTCQVFAEMGHLPEELTVTGLYSAYWTARVARHIGQRSADGDAKEAAALEIAAHVLGTNDRLTLQIPKSKVSDDRLLARRQLSSEGVLIERSTSWQFFHQSFAEYACARWLLTLGASSREIDYLGAQLSAGRTNLWSLASSVLLQVDDYDSYALVCERLPLVGPQGAKVHATAAMWQNDPLAALANVVEQITGHPDLWIAVIDALADAPRDATAVYEVIIKGLQEQPTRLASAATSALASILARSRPSEVEPVLAASLRALADIQSQVDASLHDPYTAKLLQALIDFPQTPTTLELVRSFYPQMGPGGHQAAVRMHLAHSLANGQVAALAVISLPVACPLLKDEEAIRLFQLFWEDPSTRTTRNWNTWRELLGDITLKKGWHNAKVRFIAALAGSDEKIREELVADILAAQVSHAESYVQAFEYLANQHPEWIADRLLGSAHPTSILAISAVANIAGTLGRKTSTATATALLNWLYPCRTLAPRSVWPALIGLAGRSTTAHQRIFDDLVSAGETKTVMDSALDAWFFSAPPYILTDMAEQLRSLLRSSDADAMQARARLEGRLFGNDVSANSWVEDVVVKGRSPRIAGTAVKTIADTAVLGQVSISVTTAAQLVNLLPTRHTDAARRILTMLASHETVDDEAFEPIISALVPQAIKRFNVAIRQNEDLQLTQAILDTLIRCDNFIPLDPLLVRKFYDAQAGIITKNRSGGNVTRPSTALHQMVSLCGTLMARRLPNDETRSRLGDLLTRIKLEDLGAKSVRAAASMLMGIGHRDPKGLDWMEDLFGRTDSSLGLQQAIAEVFVTMDRRRAGGRASRLKDRPDCPPSIVNYVIKRLLD
jgi:hypothetical protein